MEICKIEGFTRVLKGPAEFEGECSDLAICDRADGWMVSQWKPDAEELAALNANSSIFMWVFGTQHPVVGLSVVGHAGDTAGNAADGLQVQRMVGELKLLRMTVKRLQETLSNQERMCAVALSATSDPQ